MLSNTTGFARCHFRGADVVQQRSFTVVNVTHDGHYWSTRLCSSTGITVTHYGFFQLVLTTQDNFVAHFLSNHLSSFLIDDLINGSHSAHLHHCFDDLGTFNSHFVSQFSNGNGFADDDVTVYRLSRLVKALLQSTWLTFAFTTTGLGTCFFAIGFRFRQLIAFLLLGRFSCGTCTSAPCFNLTVVFIFCFASMMRSGYVVVRSIFCCFSFRRFAFVSFCHFASFFRNTLSVFFKLTQSFFFGFAFQCSSFGFAARFFSMRSFGFFVGILIRHFFTFRCATLSFISGLTFGLLFQVTFRLIFSNTFRFFFCFTFCFFFSLTTSLLFRFTLCLCFCFSLFSCRIAFYISALFADLDLHGFAFSASAWNIQCAACFTLQRQFT